MKRKTNGKCALVFEKYLTKDHYKCLLWCTNCGVHTVGDMCLPLFSDEKEIILTEQCVACGAVCGE